MRLVREMLTFKYEGLKFLFIMDQTMKSLVQFGVFAAVGLASLPAIA